MKVDPIRLARQELAFERWRAGKSIKNLPPVPARGIIEAVPGFGKTYILVLAIRFMNNKYPDRDAIVVVPSTKLYEDWVGTKEQEGHLKVFNLINVKVFIVNTFVKYQHWKCDLLGLDECHKYANEETKLFSTVLSIVECKYILAMSATLEEKHKRFFEQFNIPVVDTIGVIEAQKAGYVASSKVYNLGIPLSPEDEKFNDDINKKFKWYFALFQHELGLVLACNSPKGKLMGVKLKDGSYLTKRTGKDWIEYLSRLNKFDGNPDHLFSPTNIAKNAAQCMNIIQKRKMKWQNMPSKLEVAVKILERFNVKTIVFSETAAFADKLVKKVPKIAVAYHTRLSTLAVKGDESIEVTEGREESANLKLQGYTIIGQKKRKDEALRRFLDPKDPIRALSTVRAMDEGVDIPNITLALKLAYNSTKRQTMQRDGRAGRKDYDNLEKVAIVINLYMIGTQEENWMKESQKGLGNVLYVTSIDDINPTQVIALSYGSGKNKEIAIDQSAIETRTTISTSKQ